MRTLGGVATATLLFVLLASVGCALGPSQDEQHLAKEVQQAFDAGRIDEAIRIAQPLAQSSDAEMVFSVAFLYLARTQAEGRAEWQRKSDSKIFLQQVERAALGGLVEALKLLEAVFRFGGYGTIPADPALADCWRSVIEEHTEAEECVSQ